MTTLSRHLRNPSSGRVTLVLTFVFVFVFRIEQNVAHVLGISTEQLVGLDGFPVELLVSAFAPVLHGNAGHLVSTLVWVLPFGYLLERRTRWEDYVGFVFLSGVLSTTLVPSVFVALGAASAPAIGASGITHALVGREATARLTAAAARHQQTRLQRVLLLVAVVALLVKLLAFVSTPPARTSVVGHATGLVVGVVTGVGERYVSIQEG